uniref:Protein disulfide-isomerase n=1 Tax=Tetraodon nigroviridis TaxID=99883 RepID=H3CIQ9_TETNG
LLSIGLLLGLLLWTSCLRADDAQEEAQRSPPHVMVLHINNFARALEENQHLLVEFYAPWCGHCKQLEPVYAEAAGQLKEDGWSVRLAKVDATEEKELAEEFEIGGFPTLKLFVNGDRKEPTDFKGKRTSAGIIQWLKRHTSPGVPVLDSVEAAAQFIDSHNVTVVGFFEDAESEEAKVFRDVYLIKTDQEMAMSSSPEVFQKYEVKGNAVVLFKKFDEGRADFVWPEDGKVQKENITSFITDNSMELIVPFHPENAEQIFTSSHVLHCLLFFNSSVESQVELVEGSRPIARRFKGKILFISINLNSSLVHVLNYFGVSEDDAPTARLINMATGKKFSIDSDKLTMESLLQLCQEVIEGTAKPYFKSEKIPEDWDKEPVKVLVGKNFEAVALDPTKNVFVEFYAPWCGHCKELAPTWEKLAEKFADRDDIIIAKFDATANEVDSLEIKGFPTLKYFPLGERYVVDYTGKRDLETLSKFLDNGGVLPEESTEEEEDLKIPSQLSRDTDETTQAPTNQSSRDEL